MDESAGAPARWQDDLYDILRRNDVTQFAYVPDAGHRVLIARSLARRSGRPFSRLDQRGRGGGAACGRRPRRRARRPLDAEQRHRQLRQYAVADQRRPFSIFDIGQHAGDFGEGNPWQFPMGQAVQPALEATGVICLRIEQPEEVAPTVKVALTMVFQSGHVVAVLLTQKLLGAKQF